MSKMTFLKIFFSSNQSYQKIEIAPNKIFFENSSHNKLVQNKRTKMNSIGICGVARLKKILGLFYFLSISCLTSNADLLDDAMANALNTYKVKGASIAYFDRVSVPFYNFSTCL